MSRVTHNVDFAALLANAPGNPLIWERFLTELAGLLNCDSSAMLVADLINRENTHFLFSANIPQEYQHQYDNGLNSLDAFLFFISKNPQHVYCNQTLDNGELQEIATNFISPCSQNYRIGFSIPCNHTHCLSLIVNRKDALNEQQQQRATQILQSIIPALEVAIHAEQRHKINSQLLRHLGDHFDGYLIIDSELNILFSDPVYNSIISQLDCVRISGKRFIMKSPAIEQRLLSLIEHNGEIASIHNQCHSCKITLVPISCLENLYHWECYKDGFIITFTHDREKNPIVERLTGIFKLSRCEAICALHFMKTPSINDIAINTNRSQETVRNHIKHTMQKMDVHNQAELMKKLITLAAL